MILDNWDVEMASVLDIEEVGLTVRRQSLDTSSAAVRALRSGEDMVRSNPATGAKGL